MSDVVAIPSEEIEEHEVRKVRSTLETCELNLKECTEKLNNQKIINSNLKQELEVASMELLLHRLQVHSVDYFKLVLNRLFELQNYEVVCNSSKAGNIKLKKADRGEDWVAVVKLKLDSKDLGAGDLHAFVGALLLDQVSEGIYLTMGNVTEEAELCAKAIGDQGMKVNLWSYDVFKDHLRPFTKELLQFQKSISSDDTLQSTVASVTHLGQPISPSAANNAHTPLYAYDEASNDFNRY